MTFSGDLTEVPVPTRFIFILLGPQGNQMRYHEIGRSIATLMSDEVRKSEITFSIEPDLLLIIRGSATEVEQYYIKLLLLSWFPHGLEKGKTFSVSEF